jgi:hypothetical protein
MRMTYSGSGVLMITDFIGIPSIGLIYAKNKKAFEDPGGKIDHKSVTNSEIIAKNARKELLEETANLINIPTNILLNANYIDIHVKRSKKPGKYFYRVYLVCYSGIINRKDFLTNLKKIRKRNSTPKCFLETTELILAPLEAFKNIYKIQGRYAILVENTYIPISKRLKRIFSDSNGLKNVLNTLNDEQPVLVNKRGRLNKSGWKRGTITYNVGK